MKKVLSLLLIAAFLTTSGQVVAQESPPEQAALEAYRVLSHHEESDDEVTSLRKQIIEALADELEVRAQRVRSGQIDMHVLLDTLRRMNIAVTQLATDNARKVAWLEIGRPLATMVEEWQQELVSAGVSHSDNYHEAKAFRLALELQILQLVQQLSEEESEEVRELREHLG
ncbi:MAG: hypothetical protein ACR2NP_03490 [Pirellulaceae bacterium]